MATSTSIQTILEGPPEALSGLGSVSTQVQASQSTETVSTVTVELSRVDESRSSTQANTLSTASTTDYFDPYGHTYTSVVVSGTVTTTEVFYTRVATTTITGLLTFTLLSTTIPYATTVVYDPNYPPNYYNGRMCQYYGQFCPPSTTNPPTGLIGSLYAAESSAELAECISTFPLSSATAETTWTVTEVDFLPPTAEWTTVTKVESKEPWQRVGCCGACELTYSNVEVYYFPPTEWNGASCVPWSGDTVDPALPTALGNGTSGGRTHQLQGSTLVNADGYTL